MERWPRKTKFPLAIGRGKLKSRWILLAGQILLFQCGKRWQDEGQWEGRKAESEIPKCAARAGWAGAARAVHLTVVQERGAVHIHLCPKGCAKGKRSAFLPLPLHWYWCKQNIAVVGVSGEAEGDWEWWGAEPFTKGKQAEIMLRCSKILASRWLLSGFQVLLCYILGLCKWYCFWFL